MTTEHLHPSGYPWAERVRVGMLRQDAFVEGELSDHLQERVPVVAVGSNAAPSVLVRKLGGLLETGLPVGSGIVDGLHIGHSAHVSARGYVAAAPARGDLTQPVTLCWFDAAQLAVLDATEPNYRRVRLPGGMPCRLVTADGAGGPLVQGAQVYESVHGVLGESGHPLPLQDQDSLLRWLAERLPTEFADVLAHDHLVDVDLREQVRRALVEADLVVTSGL
ncbi:hypothetical protein [Ornithinimicrobium cryptoxanthini]|uniref:Uncharacterized protein n=1 Tax=Ornithinimicrobium cryptoxanthini TaxID=2934161 RepID=A0ABY4YH90_9MICO|nr:hypothetical protein [Ornithinimicrobium cryptoxanthini]USQ75507.1 hypothetical protein NF557_12915 [Ornithinimicrobium cryptoxanthini]